MSRTVAAHADQRDEPGRATQFVPADPVVDLVDPAVDREVSSALRQHLGHERQSVQLAGFVERAEDLLRVFEAHDVPGPQGPSEQWADPATPTTIRRIRHSAEVSQEPIGQVAPLARVARPEPRDRRGRSSPRATHRSRTPRMRRSAASLWQGAARRGPSRNGDYRRQQCGGGRLQVAVPGARIERLVLFDQCAGSVVPGVCGDSRLNRGGIEFSPARVLQGVAKRVRVSVVVQDSAVLVDDVDQRAAPWCDDRLPETHRQDCSAGGEDFAVRQHDNVGRVQELCRSSSWM